MCIRDRENPVPNPAQGSAPWAGKTLGGKAIETWRALVDRFELPGANPSAPLWEPASALAATTDGHAYVRKLYPLMTTEASATDRAAFIGVANPFLIYTGGRFGTALLEPAFTYEGLGRDFAALVQRESPREAAVRLHGFFDGSRQARLVPWSLQPGAEYRLRAGPDLDGDGTPDEVAEERTFQYASRGTPVPFTLPGRTPWVIEVERAAPGPGFALLPDPAWDARDPVIAAPGGTTLTARVHNVGGASAVGVRTALFREEADGSRTLVAEGSVDLPAPAGLQPSVTDVVLTVLDPESWTGGQFVLVLDPDSSLAQITTRNDERALPLGP